MVPLATLALIPEVLPRAATLAAAVPAIGKLLSQLKELTIDGKSERQAFSNEMVTSSLTFPMST